MTSLYRILIGVSAAALLLGLILLAKKLSRLESYKKLLYIMAVANLISMLMFLFNLRLGLDTSWKEAIVFLETTVLVLNLVIAFFIVKPLEDHSGDFFQSVRRLFPTVFVSVVIYLTVYYLLESTGSIWNKKNESYFLIYGFSIVLYLFGSLYPAIRIIKTFIASKQKRYASLLLILNGLNNTIGLLFFTMEIPNKEIAILLNIIFNVIFSYYMAFYFLSVYFDPKSGNHKELIQGSKELFSWAELKNRLNYWGEVKTYLNEFYPEVIQQVDELDLTELEKIHYALKQINIKAKDIASAMNVSVKAVEMSRYRIKRKLEGNS